MLHYYSGDKPTHLGVIVKAPWCVRQFYLRDVSLIWKTLENIRSLRLSVSTAAKVSAEKNMHTL